MLFSVRTRARRFLLGILLFVALICLSLYSYHRYFVYLVKKDSDYIITGEINESTVQEFLTVVISGKPPKVVLFEDVQGGLFGPALEISNIIRRNQIKTLAHGKCVSACVVAFLGGAERSMVVSPVLGHTILVMHALTYPKNNLLDNELKLGTAEAQQLYRDYLDKATENKMPAVILDAIVSRTNPVHLFAESVSIGTFKGSGVRFCNRPLSRTDTVGKCDDYLSKEFTPKSIGLVTR